MRREREGVLSGINMPPNVENRICVSQCRQSLAMSQTVIFGNGQISIFPTLTTEINSSNQTADAVHIGIAPYRPHAPLKKVHYFERRNFHAKTTCTIISKSPSCATENIEILQFFSCDVVELIRAGKHDYTS